LDRSFNYIISPEISEFRRFSPKLKIGVLASGKGTNFQELINLSEKGELDIDIKVLITNKDEAGCIGRAVSKKIPYKLIRGKDFLQKEAFELEIINTLIHFDVELVVMAGWMKIVTPFFINKFKNKIINIHPSLLPKYKGLNTHQRALDNHDKYSGCTVHFVNSKLDSGKIILQKKIKISKNDTKDSLAKKVLFQEHKLYPRAILKIFNL